MKEIKETRENTAVEEFLEANRKAETANLNSAQENQLSSDFRETLLKSGLDISAFETEKSEPLNFQANNAPAVCAVDFAADRNTLIANKSVENHTKNESLDENRWKWQHLLAIVGILTIIVLQSVFQFSFIQNDNLQAAQDLKVEQKLEKTTKTEIPQIEKPQAETSESKKESEPEIKNVQKTLDAEVSPKIAKTAPKLKRETQAAPVQIAFRKKQQKPAANARLRRAEKLLTGF